MKEYQFLHLEIKKRVAVLTMTHPPLNLLTVELLSEIRDAVRELGKDKELRVIILTGEGKAFCAGADVNTFHDLPAGTNTVFGQMIVDTLELCPLPIIAAIGGYCLGGGMELALACDIRLASENAKIGLVEASLGLIPAYGGNTRLPWLIGEGNAKLLFYTASRLSGEEALKYGIVQGVYPAEDLLPKAMELAERIARNAPLSNATFKHNLYAFREQQFGGGFIEEKKGSDLVGRSKDAGEGLRAMKEKRLPEFHNE